jgi:hypothetical protein
MWNFVLGVLSSMTASLVLGAISPNAEVILRQALIGVLRHLASSLIAFADALSRVGVLIVRRSSQHYRPA